MSIVNDALEKMKRAGERDVQRQQDGQPAERISGAGRIAVAQKLPEFVATDPPPDHVVCIDRSALRSSGMMPREADRVTATEQYRVIKQELIRYRPTAGTNAKAPCHHVVVSSALPGDGKTFCCLNLALSVAGERDFDVLLIDGDVAKRHITRALGMDDRPGLLDVLRDANKRFSSVMYATDLARFYVVPAGQWSEDASELLASDRMKQFMSELLARYPRRFVLIDSSPLLLTPDARALAVFAGQIVLVVREGVTLQQDVKEAASLASDPGRRLTVVLNQMSTSGLFGSFYGYRYGYGYETRKPDVADAANLPD